MAESTGITSTAELEDIVISTNERYPIEGISHCIFKLFKLFRENQMSLGAVYVWEPEVTGKIPNLNESERTAYELHQKHRNTPAKGRKIKA